MLLDLEADDMMGVVNRVVEQMVISDQIHPEMRGAVMRTLLLRHRSVDDNEAFFKVRRNAFSSASLYVNTCCFGFGVSLIRDGFTYEFLVTGYYHYYTQNMKIRRKKLTNRTYEYSYRGCRCTMHDTVLNSYNEVLLNELWLTLDMRYR